MDAVSTQNAKLDPCSFDWIADRDHGISELSAASRAQMPPVRVNAKPVFVEMRISTKRADDFPHLVPKDAGNHVVDRVELAKLNFVDVGTVSIAEDHPSVSFVEGLLATGFDARVHVDAAF